MGGTRTGHERKSYGYSARAQGSNPLRVSGEDVGLIGHFYITEDGRHEPDSPGLRPVVAYAGRNWVASIGQIGKYEFVTLELHFYGGEDNALALDIADSMRQRLGISYLDIVPWPVRQLENIIGQASHWRRQIGDLDGRLFLIDGPSGAGKSTLARALRTDAVQGYSYIPRRSSRATRPDDVATDEYLPITIEKFREQAQGGSFLEYREFKFQMGYGVLWADVADTLDSAGTRAAYALVNLGNTRHIERFIPDATTVLVTAPVDQLLRRLTLRGSHAPEAIAERIENARRAAGAEAIADYVIENSDGRLEESIEAIREIVYA